MPFSCLCDKHLPDSSSRAANNPIEKFCLVSFILILLLQPFLWNFILKYSSINDISFTGHFFQDLIGNPDRCVFFTSDLSRSIPRGIQRGTRSPGSYPTVALKNSYASTCTHLSLSSFTEMHPP